MSALRLEQRRRGQKKRSKNATLNLVSLMDIFTILVFFLMFNSSEVVMQTSTKIKLPESSAEKQPKNQLIISIDRDDIIVQGRPVAKVMEVKGDALIIEGLKKELEYQAARKGQVPEDGFEVTVMGDREIPYWLLKKIMYTCQTTDLARIALAVNRSVPGKEQEEGEAS